MKISEVQEELIAALLKAKSAVAAETGIKIRDVSVELTTSFGTAEHAHWRISLFAPNARMMDSEGDDLEIAAQQLVAKFKEQFGGRAEAIRKLNEQAAELGCVVKELA